MKVDNSNGGWQPVTSGTPGQDRFKLIAYLTAAAGTQPNDSTFTDGDALNGSYISTHYSVDDPSPAIQAFVETYKQRYGQLLPDAHAALAYDAARILFDAMSRGGVTDNAKLRDALAQTKNFPGVTGIINIDANRNAVKPAVVLKLHDLKSIYQETIQPEASRPAPSPRIGSVP